MGAAVISCEDENFITSRKKVFLRVSHVSWQRQQYLKALFYRCRKPEGLTHYTLQFTAL